jgi:RND family efflux transporter MFP subunit
MRCTDIFAESAGTSLTFDATLLVENDVEVKTRLTGIIEEIYVERGSTVKKGAPLARLDNKDLALEVEKAEVSVRQSKAEFERAKSLKEQKLLSDSEFDQKKMANDKADSEYELAKVNFEKSIIKAPFAGVVTERNLKLGQRVVEDDNVALFRITAMEPLLARIFVPEEQLHQIEKGQRADFVPAYESSRHFAGRIKWINSIIDPASGTAAVLIELFPSPERGVIKPGTSGKVTLLTGGIAKQKTKS